jgi:hypothetical protein
MKMKQLILIIMVILMSASIVHAQELFCNGDFNYDGNCDADDVSTFLEDFGRSQFFNPCPFDGPAPVAKTGQTTSYHEGDDGHRQRGVEWPVPRFLDEDDGTILDRLTGLRWLKNANCFGLRDWYQALTDCNVLANGQCGLTDGSSGGQWRLPSRFELESLLDLNFWEPALSNSAGTGQWTHGDPFTHLITDGNYWSSTTVVYDTSTAWGVGIKYGLAYNTYKVNISFYVWPVRGGH